MASGAKSDTKTETKTATVRKKGKKTMTHRDIIDAYMEYVLEHEEEPTSIYKFCKRIGIEEKNFYDHFGSFESLKKGIWNTLFDITMETSEKSEEYYRFSNREKLLTFFYAYFEMLTLNRSYILFTLKHQERRLTRLEQLSGLRKRIKDFAAGLIEDDNDQKTLRIRKKPVALFSEGAWVQFLFLLRFWLDDDSKGFEKTDVAIEKSVNTVFDVFDNTPLDSILDLGKFLWKEKIA